MTESIPLLEFDGAGEAVIEPGRALRRCPEMPAHLVFCFFREVLDALVAQQAPEVIFTLKSEIGANPIYRLEIAGRPLAVMHPGVGAPLAAGFMEEAIALGARKIIACGGAGVLEREIAVGRVIVPTAAVRDEGTSYHYLPPGAEVAANPQAVAAIEATLQARQVSYLLGKTWTTDGLYRETPARVQRRRAAGCITVEMETAAFLAVAQFRGVTFGQILYGGDDVSSPEWDHRDWASHISVRERLFWLAAEACLRL